MPYDMCVFMIFMILIIIDTATFIFKAVFIKKTGSLSEIPPFVHGVPSQVFSAPSGLSTIILAVVREAAGLPSSL